MTPIIDAAAGLRIVARARKAGMGFGAILDALGVTDSTIRSWRAKPEAVPQARVRKALAALREKVRAERRKAVTR